MRSDFRKAEAKIESNAYNYLKNPLPSLIQLAYIIDIGCLYDTTGIVSISNVVPVISFDVKMVYHIIFTAQ